MSKLVSVEVASKVIKEVMNELGYELLPFAIAEIVERCNENPYEELTDRERVIAGLRYYEYLNKSDDQEEADYQALKLHRALIEKHNIDFERIRRALRELGLH